MLGHLQLWMEIKLEEKMLEISKTLQKLCGKIQIKCHNFIFPGDPLLKASRKCSLLVHVHFTLILSLFFLSFQFLFITRKYWRGMYRIAEGLYISHILINR